jgi:hypothetical protein
MDQSALEHVRQRLDEEVKARFGDAVDRVVLLQYGDDPEIEPGELAVRVLLAGDGDRDELRRILQDFGRDRDAELEKFREELSARLPEARRLQFQVGEHKQGPVIVLNRGPRSLEARALAGAELTPVMTRMGPTDLETLDALITAGIASSRAEAVRWALARIRERPAYEQLRTRAQEIEQLKSQF